MDDTDQHGRHFPLAFEHTTALATLWVRDVVPVCVVLVPLMYTRVVHVTLPP